MKIERLKQDDIIKNYRELCKILEIEVKEGNSKPSQMKEIERYIKLEKMGYKLKVVEIYPEPLPKEDGRVNNGGNISNTKYYDLMDRLIINLLVDYDGYIEESFSSLMNNYFDFFTKEYDKLFKTGYRRYAQINNMSSGLVMTYQQKIKGVVEGSLVTSLKRLDREGIIKYEEQILIRDSSFEPRFADKNMRKKIADTEKKVYEELKMTGFDRSDPRKNRQFKNKVSKYLDIMSYYNVYCFELIDKTTTHIEEDRDELVRRYIKSVIKATKNKSNKNEFTGERYKPFSYPKYKEEIDKLTKLLWKLPDGYQTETEINKEMVYLFGNAEKKETATTNEDDYSFEFDFVDMEDAETEYNDLEWGIPF